jgi:hypothetical protein
MRSWDKSPILKSGDDRGGPALASLRSFGLVYFETKAVPNRSGQSLVLPRLGQVRYGRERGSRRRLCSLALPALEDILSPGVKGVVCVVQNKCGRSLYLHQIDGHDAAYLGEGDHHDSKFDWARRWISSPK